MNDFKWVRKAMVLGAAFFLAVFLVAPVGVSTQYSVLSGIIHNAIDDDLISEDSERESGYRSTNAYYDKSDGKLAKSIKNPLNYSFVFVLTIPFGAYLGYRLSKREKTGEQDMITHSSNSENIEEQGFAKKYLPGFISGFLILYGARMAGGCTSGHMMSGIMQGSVSGFIFTAAVFAVAIPVSMLMSKKINKRGVTL